jgi:hypothetical protein
MKKRIIITVLAVLGFSSLHAQGNTALGEYFDSHTIRIAYSAFGGLMLENGSNSTGVSYGVKERIRGLLRENEASAEAFKKYETGNLIGRICLWGGLGVVMVGSYLPLFSLLAGSSSIFPGYGYGLAITGGGLALELTGAFILGESYKRILEAVNAYNRFQVRTYRED